MKLRSWCAGISALACVSSSPASANPIVVGANAGRAGSVAVCIEVTANGRTYQVCAACSFSAALTVANTLIITYQGGALSASNHAQAALLTNARCSIRNATGNTQSRELSLNGPATVVADSTILATSGPKEWPVEDVTICSEGLAIWGPTPVVVVSVPETCQTSNGR